MISSRSDYRFINQSSLNDIIIDGGIMPRRSSESKKVLRGEDVAFFIESEAERVHWWNSIDYINPDGTQTQDGYVNFSYNPYSFDKRLSLSQLTENGFTGRYKDTMFGRITPSSTYDSAGFKTLPTFTIRVVDHGEDPMSGLMASLSDYRSTSTESVLRMSYVQGRLDNIPSVKGSYVSLLNNYCNVNNERLPYEVVYSEGGTVVSNPYCWTVKTRLSVGLEYQGCTNNRVFRLHVNGSNVDVISVAELWLKGTYRYYNGSSSELKDVAMKVCDGQIVTVGSETCIDFNVTINKSSIDSLISACGFPVPAIDGISKEWSFNSGSGGSHKAWYYIIVKFSNRSTW